MSDKPETETADTTPKKRRARRTSNYLVLRKLSEGHAQPVATVGDIDNTAYELVASNGTVNGCLKKIRDDKIAGELTIVCVRRKPFISSKQEEMVFKSA